MVANICPNMTFSATCLILLWKVPTPPRLVIQLSNDPNIIGVQFQGDE